MESILTFSPRSRPQTRAKKCCNLSQSATHTYGFGFFFST
jgi:hypothetical protein